MAQIVLRGTYASKEAVNRFFRRSFPPNIVILGAVPPSVNPIGKAVQFGQKTSQLAADRGFRRAFSPIIKRAGGRPAVARSLIVNRAAKLESRRPSRVGIGIYTNPHTSFQPPIGGIYQAGLATSRDAAIRGRRSKPVVLILTQPNLGPPPPPLPFKISRHGRGTSHEAALLARRAKRLVLYLTQPNLKPAPPPPSPPTEQFANDCLTTLTAPCGLADTTITVASATGFPTTGNFRLRIDNELLLVTAVAGKTWTVTRAVEPVSGIQAAATHNVGATVAHDITAASIQLAGAAAAAAATATANAAAATANAAAATAAAAVAGSGNGVIGQTAVWVSTTTVSAGSITDAGSAIGFFGATPVGPQTGDVGAALVALGLMTGSPTGTPDTTQVYGWSGQQYFAQQLLPVHGDGAMIWDLNVAQAAKAVLNTNVTSVVISNQQSGGSYSLMLVQDGTGGRTVNWGPNVRWDNGMAPTLSTAPGAVDRFVFISDGTYMDGSIFGRNFS